MWRSYDPHRHLPHVYPMRINDRMWEEAMKRDVCAVVGGQFGSEGKGAVVARVAKGYLHHVRVGGANAGHTFYTRRRDGSMEKHVMQQLPCAAYVHPNVKLYIGPGAIISADILLGEIELAGLWRAQHGWPKLVVRIDGRAHVVQTNHIEREAASGLADAIGSTSAVAREGIGAAQAARVMREAGCCQAGEWLWPPEVKITDVPKELHIAIGGILLEGTQGYGLSLTTGRHPWITSRNTTAAGLCADCGVAPSRLAHVILVVRTFPIRVAGPSGPFDPGSVEIDWQEIGIDPSTEKTTVTRKVRRVATFSKAQVAEAAAVNGATEIALMFADYMYPSLRDRTAIHDYEREAPGLHELIREIEHATRAPVTSVGTGPWTIAHRVIAQSTG